jgi:hypothetical protein
MSVLQLFHDVEKETILQILRIRELALGRMFGTGNTGQFISSQI